ncbi:MAG: hypothetical protein E7632_02870 [Ruminococcaceae bacterium]|nr:hypothetical protein [Oscillospiraceae bacterium]
MDKKVLTLDGSWKFSFTFDNKQYQAEAPVPGNVEPVLQKLGLVDDYLPADSIYATEQFDTVDDWTYTTTFDLPELAEGWKRELVFDGIDTIAEIYLNGEKLGDCENMHMQYRFDIADKCRSAGNELTVVIRSVDLWSRAHSRDEFGMPHGGMGFYDSQTYVRKARHQWGWDNAPRLITSGIVRSVTVEDLPPKRFTDVYVYTNAVSESTISMGISYNYLTDAPSLRDLTLRVSMLDGEEILHTASHHSYFTQGLHRLSLGRDKFKLWWPSGYGEPQLYTMRLEMLEGGEVTAVYETKVGLRTLNTIHTNDMDADGNGEFVFLVNNEKVFIRGANWKPLSPMASEADVRTREGKALAELTNLNCNMVRIWGGGIYEDEAFFDYCDSHGIMVWQDFMFACEIPPTDEAFCRLVSKEAVQIIKKQRNHASMAIWCGDNENDQNLGGWGSAMSNQRPSHSVISRRILRDAVLHFDPYRDYVDSSPVYSDEYAALRGKDGRYPTEMHLYPNSLTFGDSLRNCRSKLIGETGPINFNAIAPNDAIYEREKARMERLWDSPWLGSNGAHQNDGYFTVWRNTGKDNCLRRYGRDFTFAEWKDYTLAINIICAEIFKDVLEYSRIVKWSKTGIIWWSLYDMWPMAFNYSVIDCDGNYKLPAHWIRQSQQAFLLAASRVEIGGEMSLYAANDTLTDHKVSYTVTAYGSDCQPRTIASGIVSQTKNSTSLIQRIAEPESPELWIIRWEEDGKVSYNHAFTGWTAYETMREWVKIIGRECGFLDGILELK